MAEIADVPKTARKLRACLTCHLVKSLGQFADSGCDNCGNHDINAADYTTPVFHG
jgi:Spt4/RpoE2 zinc finger